MLYRVLAAFAFMLPSACTNTDFAGGSGEAPPNDGRAQPGDQDAKEQDEGADDFEVPSDCTPDGVTQARLLTKSVKNDTPGEFVEYEISVSDCEGKAKTIRPDKVLFDTNSYTDAPMEAIRFEVRTVDGEDVAAGQMEAISGKDLFGQVSETHFHYRTDKSVEFRTPETSFIFRVETGNGRLTATENGKDPDKAEGDQLIETFLRFGEAKPVKKDVLFTED